MASPQVHACGEGTEDIEQGNIQAGEPLLLDPKKIKSKEECPSCNHNLATIAWRDLKVVRSCQSWRGEPF